MIINLFIAIGLLLLAWLLDMPIIDITTCADSTSIVGVIVQISAIMIGFIITAFSILLTVSDKPLIKNSFSTGHYSFLLRRLILTVLFFGANLGIGLYLLFTTFHSQKVFLALIATLVIATVLLIGAARLFLILITNLNVE